MAETSGSPHKSRGQSKPVSAGGNQRDFPQVLPVKERSVRDLHDGKKHISRTIPDWVSVTLVGLLPLGFYSRTMGFILQLQESGI